MGQGYFIRNVYCSWKCVCRNYSYKTSDNYGVHNTPNGTKRVGISAYAFLYLLGLVENNGYNDII